MEKRNNMNKIVFIKDLTYEDVYGSYIPPNSAREQQVLIRKGDTATLLRASDTFDVSQVLLENNCHITHAIVVLNENFVPLNNGTMRGSKEELAGLIDLLGELAQVYLVDGNVHQGYITAIGTQALTITHPRTKTTAALHYNEIVAVVGVITR